MRIAAIAILSLGAVACSGGGSGALAPQGVAPAAVPPTATPVPGSGTAGSEIQVGAWVRPLGLSGTASENLSGLETQIGRRLDIAVHYDAWTASFPSVDESNDRTLGRTPEVSWNCGGTDADVAAGRYDALITTEATAMAAYRATILLRYKWEFNLPDTVNNRTACADPVHDTNGTFSPVEFVAAWQHIHAIFVAAGATNVKFLWNPNASQSSTALAYWPGDAYVDWTGVDAYDINGYGLARTLAPGYARYSEPGTQWHPFILAETGATTDQPTYLDGSSRAMLALQFPNLRALTYFDAAGPAGNWSFTPAGLASFKIFANQ